MSNLVVYAMTPNLHRGHGIALLHSTAGSGFYDRDNVELGLLNQRLIQEAQHSFAPLECFADGPLMGQYVSAYGAAIQAKYIAPSLIIADEFGQERLQEHDVPFIERVFTSFILDNESRDDLIEAYEVAGGNPHTATTFTNLYHGLIAVCVLEWFM